MIKKIILSSVIITLLCLCLFQYVSAIGMMTQPILVKNILRGQDTVTKITLLNSEDKKVTYGLKAEGQIATWATFYKIDDVKLENPIKEIMIPVKGFADVRVKFSVPKDMPNGKYTGQVLAFLTGSGEIKNEEASVNVSQQVGREVTIFVTDKETFQFKATFIPVTYDVQPGKPLKIRVLYDNQGNVAVRPDLQLKITKEGKTIYNVIFPYPEGEESARALGIKEIPAIEWQTTGQESGNYKAEFTVFLNDKEIQKESVSFSIGYFNYGLLGAISLVGGKLNQLWLIVGVALILFVVFVFLNKNKRGSDDKNYLN